MTNRTPLLIALIAAAALAGCKKEDHTIIVGPAGTDDNGTASAPVALPPSITATKSYRCADNKVISVNWLSDNMSATIRTEENGVPTQVTTVEAGKPMTAPGGYSLSGTAEAASVRIGVPGHPAQSCKA